MSRNVTAAALALTLAGGVYLAGAPAEASNMGFKLERSLDVLRDPGTGRPFDNVYWLSAPLFNGLGDIANTADAATNKCVGDVGGPAAGDGIINVDDFLCDVWTSRTLNMQARYYDQVTCNPIGRTAQVVGASRISFVGTPFAIPVDANADGTPDPGVGYEFLIASTPGGPSPTNRAVVVGSHDPSFPGHVVNYSPTCAGAPRRHLVSIPYHTMLQNAVEVLCGLEGVDWLDDGVGGGTAGDGLPDVPSDCQPATGAIFDGQLGQFHALQIQTYVNEVGQPSGKTGLTVSVARVGASDRLNVSGTNFALRPGDAYLLNLGRDHVTTTFRSPHF